jgi:4-alpha-glucanotransferase
MKLERSCGILLHISSLPGRYGTGTLGPEAYEFAELLHAGGQSYWQVLPIGPVAPALGYSPYASTSTFAGNPLLISLEKLRQKKWFTGDIDAAVFSDSDFCDFDAAARHKLPILRSACESFLLHAAPDELDDFTAFCTEAACWLDDYALFSALGDHFGTNHWPAWDKNIARREPGAVESWRSRLGPSVRLHSFLQFLFFKQWGELKSFCARLGIKIIGDIPIYVTFDSADAWAHAGIFQLDENTLLPEAVAGVPPDYFSTTGQRWGNPLYRWQGPDKKLFEPAMLWWTGRLRHLCRLFDVTRIDHFRGFESYWAIPPQEKTAVNGSWEKGPGALFFKRIRAELGELPLIAEDLGIITPAVNRLRRRLKLPGMKILQFAFDGSSKNPYLPHNYTDTNCVVYTGTHDNNTTNGWFYGDETGDCMRGRIMDYIGATSSVDFHWHAIRLAYGSVADLAMLPAQDVLGFGEKLRMNTPGTAQGNWRWKLMPCRLTAAGMEQLRHMAGLYGRMPDKPVITNSQKEPLP